MGRAVRSPSTCLKTPQYFKEGRLQPFFANNVDIPFARARRLRPCPRKATVRSGKHMHLFRSLRIVCEKLRRVTAMLFGGREIAVSIFENKKNIKKYSLF